jgi:predicted DNA-binding transcriptional regulator AlpA
VQSESPAVGLAAVPESDPSPAGPVEESFTPDVSGRKPRAAAILTAPVEPLLVAAAEAARLCGISEASWHRLRAAGKLPSAVRLGGRVLWRVAELRRWCIAGCPDLRTWQALENANGRRGTGR